MPTETAHPLHRPRPSLTFALAGSALLLFVVFLFQRPAAPVALESQGVPETERWRYTEEGRATKLAQLRATEQKAASSYGWVDAKNGVVRLPLERAMELTLNEIRTGKSN